VVYGSNPPENRDVERVVIIMRTTNIRLTLAFLVCTMSALTLSAKTKHHQDPAPDQDRIVIESHLSLNGAPVIGFIATQHYSRSYVYVERGTGNPVTLIDITDAAHPVVLSQLPLAAASGELLSVAGTAALAGQSTAAVNQPVPQSVSIMDFSDPAQPKVTKTFDGVTALEKVAHGSIILLANKDGIWILRQHFALDPKIEEEYARHVLYQ